MLQNERLGIDRLLEHWQKTVSISSCIVHWQIENEQAEDVTDIPDTVHPYLIKMLNEQGIYELYSHQSSSWDQVQAGRNVVIETGTSSGKTLCYNLPALNDMINSGSSRSIYLFPTKALTQDQYEVLNRDSQRINTLLERTQITIGVYDGDTPHSRRKTIRENARIILTNPDMIHAAILPNHTTWHTLFENLKFVVIDELHSYRGVFGSHIANVIRRLKRIASFYGSKPQFILTSATIANPKQLAEELIEEDVAVVSNDGSPRGKRNFLLYNPPITHEELGIRRNPMSESIHLAGDLLAFHVQSILFARSRRMVELAYKNLVFNYAGYDEYVFPYRSGYLPKERRAIEQKLRKGQARLIISTNALELGIDIGGVHAIMMIGYPGSINSFRQQSGRAGRENKNSATILVASSNPLDQFLLKNPEYLFNQTSEHALINPNNPLILFQHIRCAAFELPFSLDEPFGRISPGILQQFLELLKEVGDLHYVDGRYFWVEDQFPSSKISLRSTGKKSIILQVQVQNNRHTIGEIDETSSYWMVHPNAIYFHAGRSYFVEKLDLEKSFALLKPSNDDYYTEPKREFTIQRTSILENDHMLCGEKYFGEIVVTSTVTGFRKIQWHTHEILAVEELEMPKSELHTTAFWIKFDQLAVQELRNHDLWSSDPNNYGPDWDNIRNLRRKMDDHTCQVCGSVENQKAHHVHHKVPFRNFDSIVQANQMENLITLCPSCHHRVESSVRIRSGLNGLSYALRHLAPLLLFCDINDIAVLGDPQSPLCDGEPGIVVFDQIPHGIGLSEALYHMCDRIIHSALILVRNCECKEGCPSCVGAPSEGGIGAKKETLALLNLLSENTESLNQ
ncbi:MAG: DEAD/DEAH box helicase [Anaerolineaceae bacterium]|nr:DEAD/DEAH box helicase [Anaerolineaceae bacterium]